MSEEFKYLWLDHSMVDNRVIMVIEVIGMTGLHPAERVCRIRREKEASDKRALKRPCRSFKVEQVFSLEALWKFSMYFSTGILSLCCVITF